ncbi:MAG TPA: hypothetical protein VLC71_00310 [Thermomonas sp.]|nr:hypothetical protein [Thermomonas sp.]
MPSTPAEPAIFRGMVALELRDGAPPLHRALVAAAAGELVAMLGRDLAALVPGVRDCDLALLAAHFDPAEALRPGWPLHRRTSELLQRAPGQAQGARMVGFGADADGEVPLPLQCEPELQGGGLRILPFVLHGDAARVAGEALEDLLLDRGMAAADTALALQGGLGAQVEHARYLSLHDLAAMVALQYRNTGLDALWPLLETALLEPDGEAWLDAPPEPLARYGDGEARIALLDPAAWRTRFAPSDESDCARPGRGFELFQARQRQFAAVLGAHGVPVQFVHCADGSGDCLR